jgi:hypothetical protein
MPQISLWEPVEGWHHLQHIGTVFCLSSPTSASMTGVRRSQDLILRQEHPGDPASPLRI